MAKPATGESHIAAGNTGAGPSLGTETMSQLDFGPAGVSVFSGSGAPGNLVNGKAPDVGDLYVNKTGGWSAGGMGGAGRLMSHRIVFKRRGRKVSAPRRQLDNVGRRVRRLSPRQLADKSVESTYDMPGSGGLQAGMR